MPDYLAEWRRALELLASSPEGVTEPFVIVQGFRPEMIVWLVDSGLATLTTEQVSLAAD